MSELTRLIDKEIIEDLSFPKNEVLKTEEDFSKRLNDLTRSLILGNTEKYKVKIYFRDEEGLNMVNTTIWGLTNKRVILKYGSCIPIHRILRVKF